MRHVCWLLAAVAWQAEAVAPDDTSALAQASVRMHLAKTAVSEAVVEEPEGPMAYTELGPIRGSKEDGFLSFLNVPFVEPPERFAIPQPKKPWAPQILDATKVGYGCIGAHVAGVKESEDCLRLAIWLPQGGLKNLPVILYVHGGMNLRGSGIEPGRSGELTVQSAKYPAIQIGMDYRMGIFGFYRDGSPDNSGVPLNLGLRDQQEALRWVHRNIAAFGGDPNRVALMGSSQGCVDIMGHMVAPGSSGLFHRVVLISPPLDMWAADSNALRTEFMLKEVDCKRKAGWSMLRCLKRKHARTIWRGDFLPDDITRNISTSPKAWVQIPQLLKFDAFLRSKVGGYSVHDLARRMGWQFAPDNDTMPGQPRDLFAQGRWSKVPVLMTTTLNESFGIISGTMGETLVVRALTEGLEAIMGKGTLPRVQREYELSLAKNGIKFHSKAEVLRAMLTDKVWACDIRSLARDFVDAGAEVRLGIFSPAPKYDPFNIGVNRECEHGASCHSSDMHYLFPQKNGIFYHAHQGMGEDQSFALKYRDYMLAFVSGDAEGTPWKQFSTEEQAMTLVDKSGPTVVPRYRKEQCDVLDRYMDPKLPANNLRLMRRAQEEARQAEAN